MSADATTYSILDEPKPSPLEHIAVNPLWPLLAVMFAGTWLSWTWSVLNGHALGSPTRWRETAIAAGGFIGTIVLLTALGTAAGQGWIGETAGQYLLVGLSVWKLGVSYWLYVLQIRPFSLWEHFGGQGRNGILVVIIGGFISFRMLAGLPAFWLWVLR